MFRSPFHCFRRKASARNIFCLVILILLIINRDIIKTILRHPGQVFVKLSTAPHILVEQPDLIEDEASMNSETGRCPKKPSETDKEGYLPMDVVALASPPVLDLFKTLAPGGHYKPDKCLSRTKTAIIVPYRERERHLAVLLNHLVPFLIRQQAEFNIFIIELMRPEVKFNHALLANAGFMEAMKTRNFTCIIVHDVDLLPESDSNLYRCGDHPRHMAASISAFQYQLPYHLYAGGVLAIKPETFRSVNGHSNLYFGWGGEDDDFLYRLTWMGHAVSRYPPNIARYTAIFHTRDKGNEVSDIRYRLLWTAKKRMLEDGLSSLRYRRVSYNQLPLYTRILVDVDMADYTDAIQRFT